LQKIFNLGCKLNQYEGFCLLEKFGGVPDLIIVNTCCVTKEAEIKSLKKFRYALKKYPGAKIIATGCACRIHPEKFSGAFRVIDHIQREELIQGIYPEPDRGRFFLKIEDGCNEECTYCIVAKIRNRIKSKRYEDIKREIQWAVDRGYKEIVLVGANIGLYGKEVGDSLIGLLRFLSGLEHLPRIRLSSLEPKFIDKELISVLKSLPFCRHFHIPLQSADDEILSRMKRGYDVKYLGTVIDLITTNFDDVAVGADIIVGFPGEDDGRFDNTRRFIEENPFTHLHVFPYSPRPGTEAYGLGDPVVHKVKKERLWVLKNLIHQKNHIFRKRLLNRIFSIITEEKNGSVSGVTDNYIRVKIAEKCGGNRLLSVKITEVTSDGTYGEVVSDSDIGG